LRFAVECLFRGYRFPEDSDENILLNIWNPWVKAYFFILDFPGSFGQKSYFEQDWLRMEILSEIMTVHKKITKDK